MQVLDSYDFNVVKKQLSNTYDIDDIGLIIDEFKKFLALKVFENDMNAEKLSPSAVIDQAWHSLLLDPLSYCLLCQKLSNNKTDPLDYIIGHNQHGGGSGQKTRYKATLKLYKEYFDTDAPDMIWPNPNENLATNQLTQMNERKRLRTSSSSQSPSSNSFGCQTDAEIDEIEDDLPWCAVSLAWQQTDENYKLNGDTLKAVTSNEKEYNELFIKTHGECDYLIKVKPSTPALAIFELVSKFLNNNGTGVKKPSHIVSVNSFCFCFNDHLIRVSDSPFLVRGGIDCKSSERDVKDLTCSQLNIQNGSIWEVRYFQTAC
jgi:hypothetical protein